MASSDSAAGPLKVLIVGAGIGGLTAAVGLRQEGHDVTLFERSELVQEVGAAIHLAPNCHGLLKRFGVFPLEFGANPLYGIGEYDGHGKLVKDIYLKEPLKMWQHPWVLSHRVSLHNDLKRMATSAKGAGKPAVLKTGSRVASIDADTATITLDDGSTYTGDVVLGADGVSSVCRKAIVGDSIKPFDSGKSAFRFLIPRQTVLDNARVSYLAQKEGYMMLWYGQDRRLVMYPCSNNTMMNFVAIHPSALSPSKHTGGWSQEGSKASLMDMYSEFGADVQELLSLVEPAELKLWTLLDMAQMPSWVKGKMALLGDAAHPFLPHQGQGGGIAIEDAASLVALMRKGTPASEIPARLALYEKIRMHRAHKVQQFTRLAGEDLTEEKKEAFDVIQFNNYNFAHDEWHNTTHELNKWLWSRNGATYWRQPTAFGPMTSPRRDHTGAVVPSKDGRFRTWRVSFTTSATYLQTLFPSSAYAFAMPGTKARASLMLNELDNLDWLGGGGYRFFGLWIHGVRYTKADGSVLTGSYLPVLFENLCDPIITGREELGMPKLWCDIDLDEADAAAPTIVCSWRGAEFARVALQGLRPETDDDRAKAAAAKAAAAGPPPGAPAPPPGVVIPRPPSDDGLFIYRSVPSVGHPGTPDAEYAVFVPHAGASCPRVVERRLVADSASIAMQPGTPKTLPTLHHIAAGLAEVPVYSVDEATYEEGHGVDELSQSYRIE